MKILFDHQAFMMQQYGGVSRCFIELCKHFPKEIHAEYALRECNNAYIRENNIVPSEGYEYEHWLIPGDFRLKRKFFTAFQVLKGYERNTYWRKDLLNRAESIYRLKKGCFDVFHPTFFDDYFVPYLNGKPFVLTIHDMIPELYPQYFDAEKDAQIIGKRKLVPLASAIVVVSEKTKEDVVRILKVPEEKVHVVYHGCSFPVAKTKRPVFEFSYILYVGVRYDYKDFLPFVKMMAPVLVRHPELKVVCTGVPFHDYEEDLMQSMGVRDRFIHRWVKDDQEFYSLYHYAKCFIYTSEYEGFGIPILEAYKADCPVLLNNASCFPEIAGDAAIYFTLKENESNLADVMEAFLTMNEKQIELLKQKQKERLSLFSWEKSALQLARIYENVLAKS